MKRFSFSLQAVRTLRERQEQLALQTYGKAMLTWERAAAQVAALQQQLEGGWAEFRRQTGAGGAASELVRLRAYCQFVEQRRAACTTTANAAREKANRALAQVLVARQARAVVDKFYERQKHAYEREYRRYQQRLLDEIVTQQHARFALSEAGDTTNRD